jgi:hypothetical protein
MRRQKLIKLGWAALHSCGKVDLDRKYTQDGGKMQDVSSIVTYAFGMETQRHAMG